MIRTHTANVLVIGTSAAGLRAAVAAHQAGSQVLVVGKRPTLDAHTVLASGGINAALGTGNPQDSWQRHFAEDPQGGASAPKHRWSMVPSAVRGERAAPGGQLRDGGLPPRVTTSTTRGSLKKCVVEGQYVSKLLVTEGAPADARRQGRGAGHPRMARPE